MTSSGAGLVDADLGAAKVGMGGPHHVWVDIKAEGVAVSVERPVFLLFTVTFYANLAHSLTCSP